MQTFTNLFPLAAFLLAYYLRGIYVATAVLMASMVVVLVVDFVRLRKVTPMHLLSTVLVLLFGTATLLLRDPELPEVLLPAGWPGQQARLLCKELYKRLEPLSNRHLEQQLCLADGSTPAEDTTLAERFPQNDPLLP